MLEILCSEMLKSFHICPVHYLYKKEILSLKLFKVLFILEPVHLPSQSFRHLMDYTQLQKIYGKLESL